MRPHIRRITAVVGAVSLLLINFSVWAASDLYRVAWTDDPSTTLTIGWRLTSGSDPHVMYGTSSDGTGWQPAAVDKITDFDNPRDGGTQTLTTQFVHLSGLIADTAYYFEICDSEGCSDTMWFKTAPDTAANFTFVAGGDSRTNPDPRRDGNELVAKIRPLFVLFNGDFMNDGTHDEWVEWLSDWQLTMSEDGRVYPVVATHGNHENDVVDMLSYIFDIPPGGFYALNVGGNMMRIYTLNSETEPGVGYGAYQSQNDIIWNKQRDWLAADAADNNSATWLIGNYHRPMRPHTSGKAEGEGRIEAWAQAFYDNGFDVVVESDTHMAKYTFPISPSEAEGSYQGFIRDDVGGAMFIGEGSWGAPNRPTDDDKPWTMDSGSFWQFKLVHASPSDLDIFTVRFGSEAEAVNGVDYDPTTVTAIDQAAQDADPFAMPAGLDLWSPLAGSSINLPDSGFAGANIDNHQYVGSGATWQYLDDGTLPDAAWSNTGFDDSGWSTGSAQLGYGDGDEATVIDFGPDANNKHITSYFRHNFNVDDPGKVIKLTLRMMRDDGAVVYINGTEVVRSNMPEGEITAATPAKSAIGGDAESQFYEFHLMPDVLQFGSNTIAVEVHQSDPSSSDLSFDLDLTATISNITGTVPVTTADLTATPLSTKEIQLNWSDFATDEVGYQVERSIDGISWEILTWRLEADATSYLDDDGLIEGATYSYRVRPYNAVGLGEASNEITETTLTIGVPVIYAEDFESETFGAFTTYSQSSNEDWEVSSFNDAYFARMNGYGADVASSDWLISKPIALDYYSNETLSFETAYNYGGPLLEVKYSADYDPATNADPASATWATIPECAVAADSFCWKEPSIGSYTFETSTIDISGLSGQAVYFAFHYVSTGTGGGDGRVWEVDNFTVRGNYSGAQVAGADFDSGSIPAEWTAWSSSSNADWHVENRADESGAIMNGFGADELSDDWLISPATSLAEGDNAAVMFDYYRKYDGPPLQVLVSTNYVAGQDPASADWDEVIAGLEFPDIWDEWSPIGPLSLEGYAGTVHVAIRYTSVGTGPGEGARLGVDNIRIVKNLDGIVQERELSSEQFEDISTLGSFTSFSRASDADWYVEERAEQLGAIANGFGADGPSDDWLISPQIELLNWHNAKLKFELYYKYDGPELEVYISTNYPGSGDPLAEGVVWDQLPVDMSLTEWDSWKAFKTDIGAYTDSAHIAFRYVSTGTGSGDGRRWGVDNFQVVSSFGEPGMNASFSVNPLEYTTIEPVTFVSNVIGGTAPYTYSWDFGNGDGSSEENPVYTYPVAGTYTVSLTVTDSKDKEVIVTRNQLITVLQATEAEIPEKLGDVRVASFNAYLNRNSEGALINDLSTPDNVQVRAVAEIIQRTNPDVILLNEIDYDALGDAVALLKQNYLEISQNGADPIYFPYMYLAESNTGLQPENDVPPSADVDLNNNGSTNDPDDAFGYGAFYGQYAMVVLSKFPIVDEQVRTFQKFKWKDMPGNLMPTDYYSADAQDIFRLSSKSHWDVPVNVNGRIVNILASHPTPPVFDGDEDRNGRRNHDEIRLWADYVTPGAGGYLYDDAGATGGLGEMKRFVVVGDQNADPVDGDSTNDAILQLINSPMFNSTFEPQSLGGAEFSDDATDTASWGLRADYVLPSSYGFDITQGGVFWPNRTDVRYHLVKGDVSSDHRLVWLDLSIRDEDTDTDGVIDERDKCQDTELNAVVNNKGCSIAQLVPCDAKYNGDAWKNHGQYVRHTVWTALNFKRKGYITWREFRTTVRDARRSSCGKPPKPKWKHKWWELDDD